MTLDIRGSIKNTKLSSNPYVVFEELLSNAIDSFLIRKDADPSVAHLKVVIKVDFLRDDLLGDQEELVISCADNGCGLGDPQLHAFLTKDTSYKDDLDIPGIVQCKGAGRIQFFHHFAELSIDSNFWTEDALVRRQMRYTEIQKQIDFSDFTHSVGNEADIGTKIRLSEFKDSARTRVLHGEAPSTLYSAHALKREMLVAFLQRLVGLQTGLGDFEITFTSKRWNQEEAETDHLRRVNLPEVTAQRSVQVEERDPRTGDGLNTFQIFNLSHYRLDPTQYDLPKNAIALCAKSSPVRDITAYYLRTRAEQNNPVSGFHHIVLVESPFLDDRVNEQRDNFDNIPDELPSDMFSSDRISYADIHAEIDPIIEEMVAPSNWNKEEVLKEISEQFGLNEAMLADTTTRIRYGEPAKAVVERVLKKYQERVIDETAEIFSLKEEILRSEPDSNEFRTKVHELSWKYTASLKNFDMANLSQLIVRRTAIVEILSLACKKELLVQAVVKGERRKDERIIHSIFFPMQKDSASVSDHDIWLLSEEYHYYDYIASDMPLANIAWDGGEKVFDEDIDESFQEILAKRTDENSKKRPDIALFSQEGSAIIIEFKAPGIPMDDHIGDLTEYAHLLAAKSDGKLKRFYCYLIGDTLNPLRMGPGWTQFPVGQGWFQSGELRDPASRQQLGETYSEILFFDDVVDRARKRIGVYKDKLNISFS
ncbi:hypothetical protein [Inquilinus sp. CAU 1745]|uniref:hypothetical protein n=1 Tax=Inquilinus sp. CAU 1745 TaxID=3140369 RepID=UPI00325B015D